MQCPRYAPSALGKPPQCVTFRSHSAVCPSPDRQLRASGRATRTRRIRSQTFVTRRALDTPCSECHHVGMLPVAANRLFRPFGRFVGTRAYKLIVVIGVPTLIIAFAVRWLAPAIVRPTVETMIINDPALGKAIHEAERAKAHSVIVAVTPFVETFIPLPVPEFYRATPGFSIRWDNVIIAIGGLLLGLLLLRESFISHSPPSTPWRNLEEQAAASRIQSVAAIAPAEEFLISDVVRALAQSEALYSRSNLLLAGGIIMAFVGMAVFWVSLAQSYVGSNPTAYLVRAIRPFAMLVFVEAIAWFLLRQYRALIEDYKIFNRLYTRRANFLIALRIVGAAPESPAQLSLAVAFLGDDLSSRLKPGESTEAIESLKQLEPNPVNGLFEKLIETLAKGVNPLGGSK